MERGKKEEINSCAGFLFLLIWPKLTKIILVECSLDIYSLRIFVKKCKIKTEAFNQPKMTIDIN